MTSTAINREALKEKYGKEKVFCVPCELLKNFGQGFTKIDNPLFLGTLFKEGQFIDRWQAEFNPSWRQIIPYGAVVKDDSIFETARLSKSGEARLVGKSSIGIGGHINPVDYDPKMSARTFFFEALKREFNEELRFNKRPATVKFVGIINDTSDDVGKDHLGFAFVANVNDYGVKVKERQVLKGSWKNIEYILNTMETEPDKYEKWTGIFVKAIKEMSLINFFDEKK